MSWSSFTTIGYVPPVWPQGGESQGRAYARSRIASRTTIPDFQADDGLLVDRLPAAMCRKTPTPPASR